jgi:uncharacterized protein YcaQ
VRSPKALTLRQLRHYSIARSLFKPTSLQRTIARLGFLQADPMRAPARAQDLILAHRVKNYCAGDLERRYPRLAIEEAFFFNYGFLPRETLALLHPRGTPRSWDATMQARAQEVLAFVRQHGRTYPKDVQAHFDHGRIKRWGGNLNVSAHLLEGLHYAGQLRVAQRVAGTRIYQAIEHPPQDDSPEARLARAGQLLDTVIHLYAPLPAASLGYLCVLEFRTWPTRYASSSRSPNPAMHMLRSTAWYGSGRRATSPRPPEAPSMTGCVSLHPSTPWSGIAGASSSFWDWKYKLEAYVPAHKRRMGHYAMPMLWGDQMLGWANLKVVGGRLQHELGFAGLKPRGSAFRHALDEALHQMHAFLGL